MSKQTFRTLQTFRTFLLHALFLGRGNPANNLSTALSGTVEEVAVLFSRCLWAVKLLVQQTAPWMYQETPFKHLRAWAFVERHNSGSFQRYVLPEEILATLNTPRNGGSSLTILGSGRWNAQDNGGYWAALRLALNAYPTHTSQNDLAGIEEEVTLLRLFNNFDRWGVFQSALPLAERLHVRFQKADHLARTLGYSWEKSQEENTERVRALRVFLLSRGEDTWNSKDPLTYVEEFFLRSPVPEGETKDALLRYFAEEFDSAPIADSPSLCQ
jgi:hypothetical protein